MGPIRKLFSASPDLRKTDTNKQLEKNPAQAGGEWI